MNVTSEYRKRSFMNGALLYFQWLFQEPKLKVPAMYKASSTCSLLFRISPQNMVSCGTVPPFRDPEMPIDTVGQNRINSPIKSLPIVFFSCGRFTPGLSEPTTDNLGCFPHICLYSIVT